MSKKSIDNLMLILLVIYGILIFLGAFFKLQHYPYGNLMLRTGFVSGFVIGCIVIVRLKRNGKKLKEGTSNSN